MIRDVETLMKERLLGSELIVAGNFNVNLERIEGCAQDEEIMLVATTMEIENRLGNLLL